MSSDIWKITNAMQFGQRINYSINKTLSNILNRGYAFVTIRYKVKIFQKSAFMSKFWYRRVLWCAFSYYANKMAKISHILGSQICNGWNIKSNGNTQEGICFKMYSDLQVCLWYAQFLVSFLLFLCTIHRVFGKVNAVSGKTLEL